MSFTKTPPATAEGNSWGYFFRSTKISPSASLSLARNRRVPARSHATALGRQQLLLVSVIDWHPPGSRAAMTSEKPVMLSAAATGSNPAPAPALLVAFLNGTSTSL